MLRGRDFQQHAPHFIMRCDLVGSSSSTDGAAVYSCWPVPSHLQQTKHWTAVLSSAAVQLSERQLVLLDIKSSQVLRVLRKFEPADYIHCYMPGACPGLEPGDSSVPRPEGVLAVAGKAAPGMRWHLPRCSLQFELSATGSVESLDHRNYSLSKQQLLVCGSGKEVSYTLPEFQQYLVLDAQHGSSSDTVGTDQSDRVVLVPSGRVTVQREPPGSSGRQEASIRVQLSAECSDSVKVRRYSWGGRNLRCLHMHALRNAERVPGARHSVAPHAGSACCCCCCCLACWVPPSFCNPGHPAVVPTGLQVWSAWPLWLPEFPMHHLSPAASCPVCRLKHPPA